MGIFNSSSRIVVTLDDSGLLSKVNKELLQFIYRNKIIMVSEFIDMMDSCSFNSNIPHADTLLEARGLADLLKLKYDDEPLLVDSYLSSLITEGSYFIHEEEHKMLSVKDSRNKNINIYTAITRLGFNDKERQVILDRKYSLLEGRMLIDVLLDVYYELFSKDEPLSFEVVFINKLTLIINYYKKKYGLEDVSNVDYLIKAKLKELGSLMDRRNQIDNRIEALRQSILELQTTSKGVSKWKRNMIF